MAVQLKQRVPGLRSNCLSFPELFAQSIGNIAPAAMPAVSIPLVFANAGNGTWLAFLIATVGLSLVSLNINQFARRVASPGTLYSAIARNLSPTVGILAGWSLVPAYLFTAMTVCSGFVIYINILLQEFGFQIPAIALYALGAGLVWYYAYTDIQLSTFVTLILEVASVTLILVLAGAVLIRHGFTLDTSQLLLKGVSAEGLRLGLVLAIFSYVGFESATVLGEEAKRPHRFIPRAVLWSTVLAGLFYILLSYVEVIGFSGYQLPLNKVEVPLDVLANLAGLGLLGVAISAGIVSSFFGCTLASVNSGSRILYAMSRHRIVPWFLGQAHPKNETPHIAVSFSALLVFLIPASLSLLGVPTLEIYGCLGTLATYGFLLVYILISIAAPIELQRNGQLRQQDTIVSVLAVLFMLIPVVGSLYPIPPFPYNLLPYLFLTYLLAGWWLFSIQRKRSPGIIVEMKRDLNALYESPKN